jgi:DNA gyrase subunit B
MTFHQGKVDRSSIEIQNGVEVSPMQIVGDTEGRGTEVHFMADEEIFGNVEFHFDILAKRIRELSFLNNGVKIELIDHRDGKTENFAHSGGVKGFVEYVSRLKNPLHPKIFHAVGEKDGMTVEVAMQWNDSYSETVQCFTNNIPQRDGGTHLTGLRMAMTRVLNKYIEENEVAKKAKVETTGDDMREGLTCVLSVKVPEPKFSSQTKTNWCRPKCSRWCRKSSARSSPNSCWKTPTTPNCCAPRSSTPRAPVKPHARRVKSPAVRA